MDTAGPAASPSRWGRWDRAFRRALFVAFLLHLPLIPSRLFDWARILFLSPPADYDDADASAVIPIDLDLLGRDPTPDPPADPGPTAPAPPAAAPGESAIDAGAPKPVADAGAPPPDAGKPRPAPDTDAGKPPSDAGSPADPGPLADAGPPSGVKDPLAAAGGAGQWSAKDPNVQVLLSGRALRKHPLGPWASRVLLMFPEWQQFFQGTPLDPIRDFDHLLITTPRLRGDRSKLVAILSTNLPSEQVTEAIDQVVHRTRGVWIEDAPVTAARAKVDGAPRILAWVPQKKLIAILPDEAKDQLSKLKKAKGFRNGAEAMVVSLITPARPLRNAIALPETLKWARASLTPTADGGADVALEAGDRSPEDAERHAPMLTREFERWRKIDVLGLTSIEIFEPLTIVNVGDTLRGRTHITAGQLRQIMGYVEQTMRNVYDAGGARYTEH